MTPAFTTTTLKSPQNPARTWQETCKAEVKVENTIKKILTQHIPIKMPS